jgi:hypothetical protein
MPNPLLTLGQLRRLCRETLILTTATIPERSDPQTAIFFPYLDAATRAKL